MNKRHTVFSRIQDPGLVLFDGSLRGSTRRGGLVFESLLTMEMRGLQMSGGRLVGSTIREGSCIRENTIFTTSNE